MMKLIAIAVLLGGLVLVGVANQGAISWPLQSDEAGRGECVENCG
ncbi:MAG TPA: hypothetical protein VFZ01_11560 [Geminicoccaceae bacterium]